MKKILLSYSRKKVLLAAGVLFCCFLLLLFCWMYYVEPDMTISRHYTKALKKWHQEHNGLKIAILSDIHLRNTPRQIERLRQCVDLINQKRPDFVFLLGDYLFGNKNWVHCNPQPSVLTAELERLRPGIATVAVLGNHDNLFGRRTITRALQKAGIAVLENECKTVVFNGKKLQILGLPDTGTRGNILWKIQWPDPQIPTIVLAHNPLYFGVLKLPYELTLSGHNHGGQIRFPLIGPLPSRLIFLNKFKVGWQEEKERKEYFLLNNNGFGTTGPLMRLNCPPEIVFLTLRRQTAAPCPVEPVIKGSASFPEQER